MVAEPQVAEPQGGAEPQHAAEPQEAGKPQAAAEPQETAEPQQDAEPIDQAGRKQHVPNQRYLGDLTNCAPIPPSAVKPA